MKNTNLNDFVMDIVQDIIEIQSMTKVLKDSTNNENREIVMTDVTNSLEILIAKITNVKISLDKYIDIAHKY